MITFVSLITEGVCVILASLFQAVLDVEVEGPGEMYSAVHSARLPMLHTFAKIHLC